MTISSSRLYLHSSNDISGKCTIICWRLLKIDNTRHEHALSRARSLWRARRHCDSRNRSVSRFTREIAIINGIREERLPVILRRGNRRSSWKKPDCNALRNKRKRREWKREVETHRRDIHEEENARKRENRERKRKRSEGRTRARRRWSKGRRVMLDEDENPVECTECIQRTCLQASALTETIRIVPARRLSSCGWHEHAVRSKGGKGEVGEGG